MINRAARRLTTPTAPTRPAAPEPMPSRRGYVPAAHRSFQSAEGLLKRAFDIVAVLLGGALIMPLLMVIAAAIRIDSRGPILFKQRRVGLHGREFTIYKFRSMYLDAEARLADLQRFNEMDGPLFKMKDDPRVTPIGRFIRRTSLDELPQLANVLLGTMSLVGPRPPLPKEVAEFETSHKHKFDVRPGITGLWQVSGRSSLTSFAQMIELDLYYVRQWTFWTDMVILARTFSVVLTTRGAC